MGQLSQQDFIFQQDPKKNKLDNSKTFGVTKQQMRIFDIVVFSPFLFWASTKTSNKLAKYGLITLGVTTIIYNAINYNKEKIK